MQNKMESVEGVTTSKQVTTNHLNGKVVVVDEIQPNKTSEPRSSTQTTVPVGNNCMVLTLVEHDTAGFCWTWQ